MSIKETEIFTEILTSDRLGTFTGLSHITAGAFNDDPSWLWEQIKWNPWVAQVVFDEMSDKDATLFSALEKRKDGVLALPRYVKPASDSRQDKKIAAFVEETLEQFWGGNRAVFGAETYESPFESFLSEALDAVGDGVAIGEIIFKNGSDRVYIDEVKFKPPHLFAFGDTGFAGYSTSLMLYPQTGKLRLGSGIVIENFDLEAELPENKFFVFSYRPKKGNRWGSPLKRKVFWQCWMKRAGVKGWLRYIEKGSGTVVARYNDGAGADEQNTAVSAASAIQEESAVAIPKKFLVEVHEMVRNIGSAPKEFVDDYCNSEISRAIVGQTLTGRGSDGGGSRALGQVHERVEAKKIETDAKALMAYMRRIIRPIVFWNFGPGAACPTWELEYEQGEDLNTAATRFGVLRKDVGLPLSKKHLYETFQTPAPSDDADTIQPDTPAAPSDDAEALQKADKQKADKAEFAEKKTLNSGTPSNSKTARFRRLRPSMIEFSDE